MSSPAHPAICQPEIDLFYKYKVSIQPVIKL